HRHEVALPAPEAAVEIAGLTRLRLESAVDEAQGVVVAKPQLWSDNVIPERLLGAVDAFGEPQHEIPPLHMVGDLNQVLDQCHCPIPIQSALRLSPRTRDWPGCTVETVSCCPGEPGKQPETHLLII